LNVQGSKPKAQGIFRYSAAMGIVFVMPAKAGIQNFQRHNDWIPVFTGVTVQERTGYRKLKMF